MTRDYFKRKVSDIRHKYGNREAEHFSHNPVCSQCGEKRLPALTVHHVLGRKFSDVVTLCFNCHMIVHAPKSANFTYEDHLKMREASGHRRLLIDKTCIEAYTKTQSLRASARLTGYSHNTVRNSLLRNGVEYDKSRSGHKKFNKNLALTKQGVSE